MQNRKTADSMNGNRGRLRFGVVGCGAVSMLHQLPALRACKRAEIVGVVDRDATWVKKVARRFAVPGAYADYRELIGRVDAVLVATPNTTHADIATDLLAHGIHVLCEKPVATSLTDVDRMLSAAERGRSRLMAAHSARFGQNIRLMKEMLGLGRFGALRSIVAGLGGRYDHSEHRTDFRRDPRLSGGGVLVDLGVHLLDLAVWLVGAPPTRILFESTRGPGWQVESDAEVALWFGEEVKARTDCSYTYGLENSLRLEGTEGWATASLYQPGRLRWWSGHALACARSGAQEVILAETAVHDLQMLHFCSAILDDQEFLVRDEEVRTVTRIIESCYASDACAVQTGQPQAHGFQWP